MCKQDPLLRCISAVNESFVHDTPKAENYVKKLSILPGELHHIVLDEFPVLSQIK